MDMQERLERFQAANERLKEGFAQWDDLIIRTARNLVDTYWDSFMALPEASRNRLAPDWRERHARWMEHRKSTEQQ